MIAFNSIILGLEGNTGVAAYGVIANISLVVTAVYTGISQGIQPLVSTAHGQDRPGLIRQYLRYALITLLVLVRRPLPPAVPLCRTGGPDLQQ